MRDKIISLSSIIFNFDFENYLTTNNKQFIGLLISIDEEKYKYLFGPRVEELIEKANGKFHKAKAGYCVNFQERFEIEGNYDVFLIGQEILECQENEIDTIILHELVHMLIDSNNIENINFNLSKEAIKFGNLIYKYVDKATEDVTKHTEEFCTCLAEACIRYNYLKIPSFLILKNAL